MWLRHKENQIHWLLVNVWMCGGCQLEPERVAITLLILPVNEEEALSLQHTFRCMLKQVGSTKTSQAAMYPVPPLWLIEGKVAQFLRSNHEQRWQRVSLL